MASSALLYRSSSILGRRAANPTLYQQQLRGISVGGKVPGGVKVKEVGGSMCNCSVRFHSIKK